jgi:site-specific DNA-methyltransferase (adenine-specific)/modification methylase
MTPYYERGGITIYHGDCRDILPMIAVATVDLLLTDPPYGIDLETRYGERKRTALALSNDYPRIVGDAEPFSPDHLLGFPRLVLFGANHYAQRLPSSPSWLVWDKLAGLTSKRPIGFNDNADCELAWTNLGGPARLIPLRWMGLMKGAERDQRRLHPTQKPVALMGGIIGQYTAPGALIVDPYLGSGSTLVAAQVLGRRAIGIEIAEAWCEVAARRLQQDVLPLFDAAEVPA